MKFHFAMLFLIYFAILFKKKLYMEYLFTIPGAFLFNWQMWLLLTFQYNILLRMETSVLNVSMFSSDQSHWQNDALAKENGTAVGLTENQSSLGGWLIWQVQKLHALFATKNEEMKAQNTVRWDARHLEQANSVQAAFAKDVSSMANALCCKVCEDTL